MSSGWVDKDSKLIIDELNPTLMAGIVTITHLCEIMDREVILDHPRARYNRGWRPRGAD